MLLDNEKPYALWQLDVLPFRWVGEGGGWQ